MKAVRCVMSNSVSINVGEIYEVKPGGDGFSPTITHDGMVGFFYLNGKNNLSIEYGKNQLLAKFEAIEDAEIIE